MNYKTQMDAAKKGILTKEMKTVAQKEFMDETKLMELVASGRVAIPANIRHTSLSAEGIGEGLKTKINVNLGISGDCIDYTNEMNKVKLAIDFGAEAIMDLSNYGKTHDFRKELIAYSPAMIGTVPMYDAIGYLEKDLMDIKAKDFLKVVQAHAEEGVDFMTIHAGINKRAVECFKRTKRMTNIVSRGGFGVKCRFSMEEGTRFSLCDDCFAYSVSGVSSEAVLRGSAFAARRALSSAEYGR